MSWTWNLQKQQQNTALLTCQHTMQRIHAFHITCGCKWICQYWNYNTGTYCRKYGKYVRPIHESCDSIRGTTERSNHEQQSTSMMVSCCTTGRLIYTDWQIGPIVSFRCVTQHTSTTRKLRFARCRLSYLKYEECLMYKCWTKTNEMLRIPVSAVRAPTCCIM